MDYFDKIWKIIWIFFILTSLLKKKRMLFILYRRLRQQISIFFFVSSFFEWKRYRFAVKGGNEKSSIWNSQATWYCSDGFQIDRKLLVHLRFNAKRWLHGVNAYFTNSLNGGVNKLYLFVHRTQMFRSHELWLSFIFFFPFRSVVSIKLKSSAHSVGICG